jgi:hypothetical protein
VALQSAALFQEEKDRVLADRGVAGDLISTRRS